MARPGIAAVALFQFFYAWNDYFGPQIYASPRTRAPGRSAYGLAVLQGRAPHRLEPDHGGDRLVMAPVIIVFFFAQKAFIEGVTLTGVKG